MRVSLGQRLRRCFSFLNVTLATIFAAVLLMVVMRRAAEGGLVEIKDDEVAVVVDYWNGTQRVVETPGYVSTLPYFQQVFRIHRRPAKYEMRGKNPENTQRVERLLVRAKDGSSFWFDSFTLQFALIPSMSGLALQDSEILAHRLHHAYLQKNGLVDVPEGEEPPPPIDLSESMQVGAAAVHAVARSVLRDEFGRFSAEEVVLPENLTIATQESKRRLNELLEPHGVTVTQIATPKPQFDRNYEQMIDRRKVANQDMERLRETLAQIDDERRYVLSKVEKEMQIQRETQRGNLRRKVKQARQLDIRTRKEADVFYSEKVAEAEAIRSRMTQRADALVSRFDREAGSLLAHAQAYEEGGLASVRAALIKRLGSIRFSLVPYSRDPAPGRVEVEDTKTAVHWSSK